MQRKCLIFVDQTEAQLGKVDILVNNAGTAGYGMLPDGNPARRWGIWGLEIKFA